MGARTQLKNMFPMFIPRKIEPHRLSDLSNEDLALIDSLTQNDSVLYNAAVSRFHAEIRDAEREHGVPLFCHPASFLPPPPPQFSSTSLAAPSSTSSYFPSS